jgi:hypothetical protein
MVLIEDPETKEMKLEDILNDLYKKIEHIQMTIGYILEQTNLIPKEQQKKIIE